MVKGSKAISLVILSHRIHWMKTFSNFKPKFVRIFEWNLKKTIFGSQAFLRMSNLISTTIQLMESKKHPHKITLCSSCITLMWIVRNRWHLSMDLQYACSFIPRISTLPSQHIAHLYYWYWRCTIHSLGIITSPVYFICSRHISCTFYIFLQNNIFIFKWTSISMYTALNVSTITWINTWNDWLLFWTSQATIKSNNMR